MNKPNICVLFGGVSPEHAASLRSAESVLNNMSTEKYNIYPETHPPPQGGSVRNAAYLFRNSRTKGLILIFIIKNVIIFIEIKKGI